MVCNSENETSTSEKKNMMCKKTKTLQDVPARCACVSLEWTVSADSISVLMVWIIWKTKESQSQYCTLLCCNLKDPPELKSGPQPSFNPIKATELSCKRRYPITLIEERSESEEADSFQFIGHGSHTGQISFPLCRGWRATDGKWEIWICVQSSVLKQH